MTLAIEAQALPLKTDSDGIARVGRTRVTLDTVMHAFDEGSTAEEIVSRYPTLELADVYAVIAYYLNHQASVREYLGEQERATLSLWSEIESMSDYQIFRQRLLVATGKPAA